MKVLKWCKSINKQVNGHAMCLLAAQPDKLRDAVKIIAKAVPSHYVSPARVAGIMKKLGRAKLARFITDKLPRSKALRSGDLAEMLGVSYLAEATPYKLAIRRLRWKDHREMAMRGEDILAFAPDATGRLLILKGEVKSRASLTAGVVQDARAALLANRGRPSPHGLAFVADRFFEEGKRDLADMLDSLQLNQRVTREQITHLIFTFSANDPTDVLRGDLENYNGRFAQMSVGLRIETHQKFIKSVFEAAHDNGL